MQTNLTPHRIVIALLGISVVAGLLIGESVLAFLGIPDIKSGWRTQVGNVQVNQLGYKGRPIAYEPDDVVVLLVGDSQVECTACNDIDTPEKNLEDALRPYVPNVKVFSIGAGGYGQDQQSIALNEYLAKWRADYVINWTTFFNDIWNNSFRTHDLRHYDARAKPSFWLENGQLLGPTEAIGERGYFSHTAALAFRRFGVQERLWQMAHLPPPDPGQANEPNIDALIVDVDEALDWQKSSWGVWLTPRPERVAYGLRLTRALIHQMEATAHSHGAGFAVVMEDRYTEASINANRLSGSPFFTAERQKLNAHGRWYVAERPMFEANLAELTEGIRFARVPITEPNALIKGDLHLAPAGNKQFLSGVAQQLAPDMTARRRASGNW